MDESCDEKGIFFPMKADFGGRERHDRHWERFTNSEHSNKKNPLTRNSKVCRCTDSIAQNRGKLLVSHTPPIITHVSSVEIQSGLQAHRIKSAFPPCTNAIAQNGTPHVGNCTIHARRHWRMSLRHGCNLSASMGMSK